MNEIEQKFNDTKSRLERLIKTGAFFGFKARTALSDYEKAKDDYRNYLESAGNKDDLNAFLAKYTSELDD